MSRRRRTPADTFKSPSGVFPPSRASGLHGHGTLRPTPARRGLRIPRRLLQPSTRNHASQTLSAFPFIADAAHAVIPVASANQGKPWRPEVVPFSIARRQCSNKSLGRSRPTLRIDLCSSSLSCAPSRNVALASRMPTSPVTSTYWHTANGSTTYRPSTECEHLLPKKMPPMLDVSSGNCREAARKISSRAIGAAE